MLELLFAFLEMFLEIFFEAAFEFAAEFLGTLVWRGVAALFDTSEFKNPLLACVGYLSLGAVAGGLSLLFFPHLYTTEAEQEGDANRELWLWLRICIRNGPRPFFLHQGNIGMPHTG